MKVLIANNNLNVTLYLSKSFSPVERLNAYLPVTVPSSASGRIEAVGIRG